MTNGGGATPPATLPPYGNQWPPLYAARYWPENIATVCACVQAVAGAIASLPAAVYRRTPDNKRELLPDHPVARLIKQPNELQSWPDFIEWLLASALLQGNAVAVVDHDGAGRPIGLYPVPWWACQPLLVPASGASAIGSPIVPNSRLVFDVTATMVPWPLPGSRSATGFPVRYFADEVLFLRDRSDDGILGRSRLSRSPDALAVGLGAQAFSSNLWQAGGVIGGVAMHPGVLSREASQRIAEQIRTVHMGPANAGKVMVLEEGMKYETVGTSPEDAELLASRQFSVEELARLYGVPPPIIGDWSHATFSNAATAMQWFSMQSLLPWVRKVEREFSRTVINDSDVTLAIDLSGLMRGDYATLAQTDIALVRAGVITPNEARQDVGLDPHEGGDVLQAQAVGGRPDGADDPPGLPRTDPATGVPGVRPNGKGNGAAAA